MVRLDNTTATYILMALLSTRDDGKRLKSARDYINRAYKAGRLGAIDGLGESYQNIFYKFFSYVEDGTTPEFQELIETLVKQLQVTSSEGYSDLIDLMASALQDTGARNVLSGSTLTALREAVLLPGEIATLRAKLAQHRLNCATCGHQFHEGEVASIAFTPTAAGRDASSCVYCVACSPPVVTRCTSCSTGHVRFSKAQSNTLKKRGICQECQTPKTEENPAVPAEAVTNRVTERLRTLAEELRQDRLRQGTTIPDAPWRQEYTRDTVLTPIVNPAITFVGEDTAFANPFQEDQ